MRAHDAAVARYEAAIGESYAAARTRAFAGATFMGVASAGGFAAIAVVLGYGGILVSRGALTAGALTSFLVYTLFIAMSLGALADLWAEAMRGLGAADRVFALMDREPLMPLAGGARRVRRRSARRREPPGCSRERQIPRSRTSGLGENQACATSLVRLSTPARNPPATGSRALP